MIFCRNVILIILTSFSLNASLVKFCFPTLCTFLRDYITFTRFYTMPFIITCEIKKVRSADFDHRQSFAFSNDFQLRFYFLSVPTCFSKALFNFPYRGKVQFGNKRNRRKIYLNFAIFFFLFFLFTYLQPTHLANEKKAKSARRKKERGGGIVISEMRL